MGSLKGHVMSISYRIPQEDKLDWGELIGPVSFGLNVILLRVSLLLAYYGYHGFSDVTTGLQWICCVLLVLSPAFAILGLVETFRLDRQQKYGLAALAAILPVILTGLGLFGYQGF